MYLTRAVALLSLFALLPGCTPEDDATRLGKAREYRERGAYGAAIIELKKLLQGNPDHAEARLMLGSLYAPLGDAASAEKELRRALTLGVARERALVPLGLALMEQNAYEQLLEELGDGPVPPELACDVVMLQGRAHAALGRMEEAKAQFTAALPPSAPACPEAHVGLAELAAVGGHSDTAQGHLDQALKASAELQSAWLLQGRLAHTEQRYGAAEEAFDRAAGVKRTKPLSRLGFDAVLGRAAARLAQGKREGAAADVELLRKTNPSHPQPKYFRGVLAYMEGDYALAVEQLTAVQKTAPNFLPAQLLLGAALYAKGDLEQANATLAPFVDRVPGHAEARKLLAATRLKLNRPDEAMAVLDPALPGAQKDAQLLTLVGEAAARLGDVGRQAEVLGRAAALRPQDSGLGMELARVYLRQGATESAIGELKRITSLEGSAGYPLLVYAHLMKKDYEAAEQVIREFAAKNPDEAPLAATLDASVAVARGRPEEARAALQRVVASHPAYAPARLMLARLALDEERVEEAASHYQAILSASPKHPRAMFGLALITAQRGEVGKAVAMLEEVRGIDPGEVQARQALTRYYLSAGRYAAAAQIAQEAVVAAPDNTTALTLLIRSRLASSAPEQALTAARQLVKLTPDSPQALLELANVQLQLNRFDEARRLLNQAAGAGDQAGRREAHAALGRLELRLGNTREALKAAKLLGEQHPDTHYGDELAGDVYLQQRRFSQAEAAHRSALDKGRSAQLARKLAHTQLVAGHPDQAVTTLAPWLVEHPADAGLHMTLAQAHMAAGRDDAATQTYRDVIALQPENAAALNNLAWLYLKEAPEQALNYAQTAYRLAADNASIMDTMGWVLLAVGRTEEALLLLEKAAAKAPLMPEIRYHLAVAQSRSGRKAAAKSTLQELLASGAAFDERPEAEALYRSL